MIDPVPRALPAGWPVEGRTGTALPGWKGILFGLLFVAAGAFVALVAAPHRSARDAPAEVIAGFGAIFLAVGLLLVVSSARPLLRARRRARLLSLHRAEPWRADFGWDRRGIAGETGRQARAALFALVGIGAFLAAYAWFAFGYLDASRAGQEAWVFRGACVFFGLVLAASLPRVAQPVARLLRYGRGFLRFGRFPFLLGETAEVRLEPPRGLGALRVTLRCVEERIEDVRRGSDRQISVTRWQLWADERTVAAADLAGGALPLSFDLPADAALGTQLSVATPRYWELCAVGEAPGVDYEATFLVPIYAAAGAAREGAGAAG